MAHKIVILTGPPGSGKSTLVHYLMNKGYFCFPELARQVIKEEMAKANDKVPWKDMQGFSDIVFERFLLQREVIVNGMAFSDRGIPDLLAYLRLAGLPLAKRYIENVPSMGYNKEVFILPPWKEIYDMDNERKEDFDTAKKIFFHLKEIYTELGFTVTELPKTTVEERIRLIFDHLKIPMKT